ncbi:unnamed protein product [Lota lota]
MLTKHQFRDPLIKCRRTSPTIFDHRTVLYWIHLIGSLSSPYPHLGSRAVNNHRYPIDMAARHDNTAPRTAIHPRATVDQILNANANLGTYGVLLWSAAAVPVAERGAPGRS